MKQALGEGGKVVEEESTGGQRGGGETARKVQKEPQVTTTRRPSLSPVMPRRLSELGEDVYAAWEKGPVFRCTRVAEQREHPLSPLMC